MREEGIKLEKQIRMLAVSCIVIIFCVIVSGCADMQVGFNFNKDGTINAQRSIAVSSSLIGKSKLEKSKEDDRKKGFEIKDTSDGYIATKTYKSLFDMVNDGGTLWNPNENNNGVQMRTGLLYDYYSLDLFVKGQNNNIPKSNYQANIPSYFSPAVKMNAWQYMEYRQKAEAQAQEMNQMADQASKAAMNSFKMNITFNIPYSVDATNADTKTNEGKTLSWNLKPAFMDNKDITIQAQFKIFHESTIIGLIVAGVVLFILATILVVIGIMKKDDVRQRKILFGIAGVVFIVIASFSIYAKYSIDNPPKLTASDRIVGKDAKDASGKPLADTLKKEENTSNATGSFRKEAGTILNEKGINGTVSAVSAKEDDGFLALVKIDSNFFFAIYDAKDNIAALVPYDLKILNFRANATTYNDGKKHYNPLIFNMEISNDNKNSRDKDLGVWNGPKHILPIYALFKVDDNDKVIPGMLNSGKGLNPSHYQGVLNETSNVNLANILLVHMDSLKRDIKGQNLSLPNAG